MPELTDTRPTTLKELLGVLAKLGGQQLGDDGIVHEGTRIVLPTTMSKKDAVKALIENIEAEEQACTFQVSTKFRPWDMALAFERVVKKYFGMLTQVATKTFFGDIPPRLITITTGVNETAQVPWGEVKLAAFPDCEIHLSTENNPDLGTVGLLYFEGPRKFRSHVEGLFKLVVEELECCSIYRGKAFDGNHQPNFLDLSGVNPDNVIYSQDILTQLDANIWSLIRFSEEQRAAGLPLKRAVLLEGQYGTGKTLAAFLTAREATEHGWTFIYVRPGRDDINEVMQTARMYQPACVFFEDMDEFSDPSQNQDKVSTLLDMFDGIVAKGTEIMVILTTNHKERIHKGMLRPGRLDAVIHIGELDLDGVVKMIKSLVPKELIGTIDANQVFAAMEGFMPAFVKEAIDRAKRYNMARNGGKLTQLNTDDFVNAAVGLRPQLELMEGNDIHHHTDRLQKVVSNVVKDVVRENVGARYLVPLELVEAN